MGRGLDILYAVGAACSAPLWGAKMLRTGKWRTDWRGRFGRGQPVPGRDTRLLIHAVSVGEVNATRALIDTLHQQRPDLHIILSTTTNTGHDRAVQLARDHAVTTDAPLTVVRYPFDFTGSVRRFLDRTRPDAVALMELEVWPNFVQQCDRRRIPVCVINGRLTERSFRRYQRAGPLVYRAFRQLVAAGVQTEAYAERFVALGVPAERVAVLDTMKWDTALVADHVQGADELAGALGIDRGKPLIVAGSTGPGEEKLLLDAKGGGQLPGVQLLLVPRKPERFDEVAALRPDIVRRTQPAAEPGAKGEVFLLDTMGELRQAYALADVVIVGRTFCPAERLGGSDPIEPAALGRPVVVGRDYFNFGEVVEAFAAAEGLVISDDPVQAAASLLADRARAARLAQRAREVIAARRGATRRYADLLLRHLDARPARS